MAEDLKLSLKKMFPKTILIMAALSGTCLARPMDHSEEMFIIGDSRNIIFNHPIKEDANNSAEPDRTLPRSFTINRNMLWNRGIVPYEVDHNFGKDTYDIKTIFGTDTDWPYDFYSIMHYPQTDVMWGHHGEQLGNFVGSLTQFDRDKLNYMYCGHPHYCSRVPEECEATYQAERLCRVWL